MGSEIPKVMEGVGPEWIHVWQGGVSTNSVAGEAVLDFILWPSKKSRSGWYFEPGYEYGFGRAHERSARPKRRSAYRYPLAASPDRTRGSRREQLDVLPHERLDHFSGDHAPMNREENR
jgi:hypothetical protein